MIGCMISPDKEFALNRWGYTPADVASLISRVSSGDIKVEEELESTMQSGGGKALGLKICEIVASNFVCLPFRMVVPGWNILKDIRIANPKFGTILRSSSETEDWLDANSGVFPSFAPEIIDRVYFDWLKKEKKLPDIPYLEQEFQEGFGLVVDIGYSTLQDNVLMRIASGNERFIDGVAYQERHGNFTSATNDTEASVGVWDAETGEPVLPTRNFGHQSINKDGIEYYNILARPLLRALRKTGIDFGVQLEIIEHPDHVFVLHLVQIRPTPAGIYRPISSINPPSQEHRERIIARSTIVNGAFDVMGEAFFFGRKGISDNHGLQRWDESRLTKGKIGIYDKTTSEDHVYTLRYNMAAEVYYGGYLAGSDVQLTPVAIRPNTHHGTISTSKEQKKVYELLDQKCGMVSLRKGEVDKIKDLAGKSDKPLKLRVISDGLIAQVHIVE